VNTDLQNPEHVNFSTFQLHYAPPTPKTLSPTTLFSPSLKDTQFYNYTKYN